MYNNKTEGLTKEQILVYLRKSRADDALLTVEEVLAKHEKKLDDWSEANLGEKIDESNKYREVVSAETIDERPQFLEVLRRIEDPRIKAVLVVEVQRLSRGDLEDAGRLIKLLRYTGTLVITPERSYDLRDEYDRDYFERELKRGNEHLEYFKKIQKRGREISAQSGNVISSKSAFGYKKVKVQEGKKECPTLEINEREAVVVKLIFDLYVNKTMGVTKIARHLDELKIKPPSSDYWSPASIKDMLCNPIYIGKVRWNWRKTVPVVENGEVIKRRPRTDMSEYLVYEGKHDAIISEELFFAAQERFGKNPKVCYSKELKNPLAGLIRCQCGSAISCRPHSVRGEKRPDRLLCQNQVHCKTSSAFMSEVIDAVKDALKDAIADFEIRINNDNSTAIKLHSDLIKQLERRNEELNKKELSMWDKYSNEDMPKAIFEKLKEQVLQEKEEVFEALCKARGAMPDPVDYKEILCRFTDALNVLDDTTAPAELQNALLKQCIESITYSRPKTTRGQGGGRGGWIQHPFKLDIKLKV